MTKFLNISTDSTLAGNSDETVVSQKAIKAYADTKLKSGDNVSELVNDAGYLTQHQTLADLGITATASEINVLDGITASTAELNYTDGVTSNIQTQLNGKQATISDLATIRSGAALGATAVQPSDLAAVATSGSYNDLSNKPTIPTVNDATLTIQKNGTSVATFTANASSAVTANISVPTTTNDLTNNSGFITSSDIPVTDVTVGGTSVVTSGVAVVPAIPTVNDATITITQGGVTKGSFSLNQATGDTIALDAGGGGGSVAIDNSTITKNASDQIQAVATVNANTAAGATNPIYDWVGTLAEYTAQNIETAHPDWLCYITDDNTAQAFDAYSKTESDARYVQQGHQVIEFQEPTSDNNYTWYRLYADGWVEQGGWIQGSSGAVVVTLPVAMADNKYTIAGISDNNSGIAGSFTMIDGGSQTTTGFQIVVNFNGSVPGTKTIRWMVCGMAA